MLLLMGYEFQVLPNMQGKSRSDLLARSQEALLSFCPSICCISHSNSKPSKVFTHAYSLPVWTMMYVWLRHHIRLVLLLPEPLDRLLRGSLGELEHR